MSYKAFGKRASKYKDDRKRIGKRKAYQLAPIAASLQTAFPVHGSIPHECLYLDSTIVNMQTLSPSGVPLGKFTMTLGCDGATRQGRCLVLSYDKPGAWTVLQALRDYVRRHGRLPRFLCLDNGRENRNKDILRLCEIYGIKMIFRKPAEPRGGAMIESLIGVTETMVIQNLEGNTINMKNPRSVSAEVNGFKHGKYELFDLYLKLEKFIFEVRNATTLMTIGASPNELEEALIRERGARSVRAVAFNADFMLMTSPHPRGWTRRYDDVKGINLFGRYYRAPEMRGVKEGFPLEVRVEPWLARVVYVLIDKTWRIAVCNHPDLAGHTHREEELAQRALARQGAARRYLEDSGKGKRAQPFKPEEERMKQEANAKVARYTGSMYALPDVASIAASVDDWFDEFVPPENVADAPKASTQKAPAPSIEAEEESNFLEGILSH